MENNFFIDNKDLIFNFENLEINDIINHLERDFRESEKYHYAPKNLKEAKSMYKEALKIVGDITANVVFPNAESVDEDGACFDCGKVTYAKGTQENLKELLSSDFGGITLPRRYEGLNFPTTISTMIIELVSRADASLMNLVGLQDIGETINEFASEEQKEKYLPMFTKGLVTGAMVLTEPDAGSDLQAVQTKAIYDEKNNTWRLYGVKRFITNGCAEISLVLARSEEGTKDGRGLSMFIVEKDDTVQIRRIENKHGIHGSPTCEIQYNGTKAELVGKRKMGLIKYVMSLMNGARLAVSAQAIGIAEAAYREALKYAKERKQFGTEIINFPPVYEMLTRMKAEIEGSRALIYETCKYVDLKKMYTVLNETDPTNKEHKKSLKYYSSVAGLLTPMAKAYSTEMANKVTYDAVQIHGGTGYMKEFRVERLSRDARITNIYEGTTQLQVIAAIGGVTNGTIWEILKRYEEETYPNELKELKEKILKIKSILENCINIYQESKDKNFQSFYARNIVEMANELTISFKMLYQSVKKEEKRVVARLFIERAYDNALKLSSPLMEKKRVSIDNRDMILGLN
jgi:3-(methylthio)propanoyl-CoA dehydrogenase